MKILLLGAHGQLGVELSKVLTELGELIELSRNELDLSALDALRHLLSLIKPDLIVNASAYTAVDKAETEIEMAFLINAEVPKVLANYAKENNKILVHYSTDYVFDGEKTSPYEEKDEPNPICVYGASKLKGEENIIISNCKHLIFRTSWLYSAHGENFMTTILKLAKERSQLNIINDQWGSPTSCKWLAKTTIRIIEICITSKIENWGLYHTTSSISTSWHEYARIIIAKAISYGYTFKCSIESIKPISSAEYNQKAKRPKYSLLSNDKLLEINALIYEDGRKLLFEEIKKYLDQKL